MESTNTFYPVFEPDQVLTSAHLNQLRKYLAVQDRESRRLLHGIGIVCGLQISNPSSNVITISKGVGVTSKGFLISLANSVCEYYRPYEDKIYNEVNCEGEVAGKYNLFLKDDGTQYNLWELLTSGEEAEIDDNRIKPLSEATMNMDNMFVILFLEIEDLDMMACFGDDCDEKGIQRNFKARKLLIAKADLLKIIEKTGKYGDNVTETELEAEINAKYNLKPVSVKRLGYDFQPDAKTLSLSQYYNPNTLFQNYSSIVEQGALDIGKALHQSYEAYSPVLKELYSANPFNTFDSDIANNNLLYKKIQTAIQNNPFSMQYAYDFLNDLVAAYDEFRKAAFSLVAVCCPDCRWFPRHLMLGKAVQPESQPSIFRHRFISSPIMNQQKELLVQVKIYFQRLVKMVEEMNLALEEFKEIKVTPSAAYNKPISKRSIPFYYNVNNTNQLYRFWNFDKTVKHQANTVLSYHAVNKYNSSDLFVSEPSFWEYKKYDFLRIEGHVGQKYETVLSNVMSQRERLNLPIKVIGVKLSRRFQNTNADVECRFDDLENLYRMFVTELRCILVEEREFFRSLDTSLSVTGETTTGVLGLLDSPKPSDTKTSGGQEILNLLGNKAKEKKEAAPSTEKDSNKLTGGLRINTNTGKEEKLKTNSIGYLMDNVTLTEGQDIYTSILNVYATGHFNTLIPGIFIYVILYPVQIAQNIDLLLNNMPESLQNLDLQKLQSDYNKLIESATGFKTTIKTNLADPQYQRVGNEEVILYRLDKLIYHCSIKKLIELYTIYLKRVEEVKQLNLFARFAKDHPGMEHMAGVPKGGTFVIVYADKNEKAPTFSRKDIVNDLTNRPDFLETNAGFTNFDINRSAPGTRRAETPEDFLNIDGSNKSGNVTNATDNLNITNSLSGKNLLSRKLGEITFSKELEQLGLEDIWVQAEAKDDLPPDNVVIADFALPYLCCGSCTEIATMVVTQIVFRLDKTEYCLNDPTPYQFTTDPVGGVVSGPGVVPQQGGTFIFQPNSITDWKQEDIQLTYTVNNQTVVLNLKVYNPIAGFEASDPEPLNNGKMRVSFTNKSSNEKTYVFDFGDGETYEENNFPSHHDYNVTNEDQSLTVSLVVKSGPCTSPTVTQTVDINGEEEAAFEIKDVVVCNNIREKKVFFEVQPEPDNNNLIQSQQGVQILQDADADGAYCFSPFQLNPGIYTFTYRGISRTIRIVEELKHIITITRDEANPNNFNIKYGGNDFKSIKWSLKSSVDNDFNHLEQHDDEQEFNVTLKNEELPAIIKAYVTSEFGCISEVSETIEIIPVASSCYSVDVLLCWSERVIEVLDFDPIIRALELRKYPDISDDKTKNAEVLLEMLQASCGFVDDDYKEDGGSLAQAQSKRALLTCLLEKGSITNYDPDKEYSNDQLLSLINEFQEKNCCTGQPEGISVSGESVKTFSVVEKKKILSGRGFSDLEDKNDDELTKMLISDGGVKLSKDEINLLNIKSVRNVLTNKGITFRGGMKKDELISLLR